VLHFITAIPLDVTLGSGCYVGTTTLIEGIRQLGTEVSLVTPHKLTPIYTLTRVLFNETLRWSFHGEPGDVAVGIDVDGYTIAGRRKSLPHIACIKGVLGDAVRFESGATRASLAFQSSLEKKHAQRADLIITVSKYCADRLRDLYGANGAVVIPELIDLESWGKLFRANPGSPNPLKFTVLSVCRFYPRKRMEVLVRAVSLLRDRIPQLEVRIVGGGPESAKLLELSRELRVETIVNWLGNLDGDSLAGEYNSTDIFCLPSVQEGFGIVFLEAMAAGKPIVAARAAAVPEVVRNGLLVEPENPEALAEAIYNLYGNPDLRHSLGSAGLRDVKGFEMRRVAAQFLAEVTKLVTCHK
jgi:glycosyltransferase involved in cell wall biosynthesis